VQIDPDRSGRSRALRSMTPFLLALTALVGRQRSPANRGLLARNLSSTLASMSTLAEIEEAAEVLPVDQKQQLVAFLLTTMRKDGVVLPPLRDIPKATIEKWVEDDEEGYRKFKAGV